MTETGLLIAQIVFLVLLFGFIGSIVRSSAKQLGRVQPPASPYSPPVDAPRAPAVAPAGDRRPDPQPVAEPPPEPVPDAEPVRQPTLEPFPAPVTEAHPPPSPAPEFPDGELAPGDADDAAVADGEPGTEEAAGAEPPDPIAMAARAASGGDAEYSRDLTSGITPRLVVESSPALEPGSDLELEGGLTIGRSGAADLALADQYVSHMHARILRRGAYYYVEDLGSTNGTFLNDLPVGTSAQLKVHDSLRMGQTILRYEE